MRPIFFLPAALVLCGAAAAQSHDDSGRAWLAGDHHVHSEWSVDWDRSTTPPTPLRGGDSRYTRTRNARVAQRNGLRWMVHTDHGGPGHSMVTRDLAWPELQRARRGVPGLIQFHGMEFDVPGAEHASLIVAPGPQERDHQFTIERDYSRGEPLAPGARDDGDLMLHALAHMRGLSPTPLMFVNHPSRTATAPGAWGEVEPEELRAWHVAAPQVLVGMEGAPGHQAAAAHRGLYRHADAPTFGGFDQMTARVGGVWDGMLAHGHRFWITATSDSHRNLREGGGDFDPGQYSKTYVWARPEADDIMDGLREGRIFAVTGDLIDALQLTVRSTRHREPAATMGGALQIEPGEPIRIELRIRRPAPLNAHGRVPSLDHIDLILGQAAADGSLDMRVKRFDAGDWHPKGQWLTLRWDVKAPPQGGFVRVRGTNTAEYAPKADIAGEDPWSDLWFYSNPVFLQTDRRPET
ncbi:hypothetical protein [Lysobacter capsici]|uniref:hypothetical protein n=1 Tax=Lysobacter capsici TaxID=435897 RepID=UPI0007165603|nr:hypothetical protein [Lysobacter capsici]